jgi:uncharacterized protein (DUF1501 family)
MTGLNHHLTRRQLLQVGGIGMLGLGLPQLLSAGAPTAGRRGSARSCIFLCLYGGASQIDTWDMKPGAPAEYRGPYKPIATATPGTHITELMPRLARLSNRYCLIRSMTHNQADHTQANRILLSGHARPAADDPSYGSVLAKLRPATRNIPSYVWLQKFGGGAMPPDAAYLSGGFLGAAYSPLAIGTKDHREDPSTPTFRVKAFDPVANVSNDRLLQRQELLGHLDARGGARAPGAAGTAYGRMQERAFELIVGPAARRAFDLQQEPSRLRERYGMHPLGQHLLMARRLIEAGVRLVGVVGWTGLAPGDKFLSVETWDMHGNGTPIFGTGWNSMGWAAPRLDEALPALLEDLEVRGLLDSTLVVVVGEFGRTPKIDPGGKGRNHWPHCYSALLAGAGVRGGAVYGASDKVAGYVKDRPVLPGDFGATIYHALGVAPETRLAADGFTRPASTGRPILDIFG